MGATDHFPKPFTPRPEQLDAIRRIESGFSDGKPVMVFQGPTGIGKSFVAASFWRHAAAQKETISLLVSQRSLQDQYHRDFRPPEIEIMKGRTNYGCSYEPHLMRNASSGYCRRVKKSSLIQQCLTTGTVEEAQKFSLDPLAHKCDYWRQMALAVRSPVTLFNVHSFLYQQRLGRFGARDLLILDECHGLENVLLQFVELGLSDKILKLIGVRLDLRLRTGKDVALWIERERVEEKILDVVGETANSEDVAEDLSPQENEQLRVMLDRISDLKKYIDLTPWVVDVTEEADATDPKDRTRKLRVRPVFVSLFARELIFSKALRTLAMSATVLDPKIWARNLGIGANSFGYVEAPCPFPVKNRPIYLDYAGNLSFRTMEAALPALYSKISAILDRYPSKRGIIHGHSEKLCRLIIENVRSPRFIHLDLFQNRDKTALLAEHVKRPDSVIVASAMHEGVDLKDDLSRFQLICKVPWPTMDDAFVKARMEVDGSYLPYQASLKLVQSQGRSVRSQDDFADTYILDQGFESFMTRCGYLIPKWFKDAIVRTPH